MSTTVVIPSEFAAFVDDAAIFPPGNAHLAEAVRDHREHLAAPYADLLGPFVVSDVRLPDLLEVLTLSPGAPLPVTVVVTGGAGGIEPASRWAGGSDLLELHSLEIALRDLDDLGGSARKTTAAVDAAGLEVPVYVEPPLAQELVGTHGWLAALDAVAESELLLKWRTGGERADLFPTSPVLARAIDAGLDRELAFKCTAGLHHAVRHRVEDTGFEHHGFLNVLLATGAAFDGAGVDEVARLLEETDERALMDRVEQLGDDELTRARRWFRSFGCCGVLDPLGDLRRLGLVRI